jgi:hypothetical protein
VHFPEPCKHLHLGEGRYELVLMLNERVDQHVICQLRSV